MANSTQIETGQNLLEIGLPIDLELGSPEWIRAVLVGDGTINFQRHPGDIENITSSREKLAQTRMQICLGGDPIPSLRTPAAVITQLRAMAQLHAAGIEPPSFLVLQSSLWQLHENGIDARGKVIDFTEMAAGSLEMLALIKLSAEMFFPQIADRVSFAWLPHNQAVIDFIDEITPELIPLVPGKIHTLAEKSAHMINPYGYSVRNSISYAAFSHQPVIATGGITEIPFQEVAGIVAKIYAPEGSPLVLVSYPKFGPSYFHREGEPTFSSLNEATGEEAFQFSPPLVKPATNSNESGDQSKLTHMGKIVAKEYQFLQQATHGQYSYFLNKLRASGFPNSEASPETRFIDSMGIVTGWPETSFRDLMARLLDEGEHICHQELNWPLG